MYEGKIYVPESLHGCTIEWYHYYLNHPGGDCLPNTLLQVCYWKGLTHQAKQFAKACQQCQKFKRCKVRYGLQTTPPMQMTPPMQTTTLPMQMTPPTQMTPPPGAPEDGSSKTNEPPSLSIENVFLSSSAEEDPDADMDVVLIDENAIEAEFRQQQITNEHTILFATYQRERVNLCLERKLL
jgi:hypothetical protein